MARAGPHACRSATTSRTRSADAAVELADDEGARPAVADLPRPDDVGEEVDERADRAVPPIRRAISVLVQPVLQRHDEPVRRPAGGRSSPAPRRWPAPSPRAGPAPRRSPRSSGSGVTARATRAALRSVTAHDDEAVAPRCVDVLRIGVHDGDRVAGAGQVVAEGAADGSRPDDDVGGRTICLLALSGPRRCSAVAWVWCRGQLPRCPRWPRRRRAAPRR